MSRVDEINIERSVRSDRIVTKISPVGDNVGIGEVMRDEDHRVRNIVRGAGDGDGLAGSIGECSAIESLGLRLKVGVVHHENVSRATGGPRRTKVKNVVGSLRSSDEVAIDREAGVLNSLPSEGVT